MQVDAGLVAASDAATPTPTPTVTATPTSTVPANFTDAFDTLDNWTLYGSPLPVQVASVFGRTNVFDNNGDPNYNSGAISKQTFDFRNGFSIEADVYLDFSDQTGCWAGAAIGIGNPTYQSWGGYDGYLWIDLDAWGDACWSEPATLWRHAYVVGGYSGQGGSVAFWPDQANPTQYRADGYLGGWHTLKVLAGSDLIPKFYLDDWLVFTGTAPIDPSVLSAARPLWLGVRSSGSAGKAYHDAVRLTLESGLSTPTPTPTVSSPTATPTPTPIPLVGPTDLTAVAGLASIALTWNASITPAVTGYDIYRGAVTGVYDPTPINGGTPVSGTTYLDASATLQAGQTYFYIVRALRGGTASDPSNEASALFGGVSLDIPEIVSGPGVGNVIVPVNIGNADGLALTAADIWVDYDTALVRPVTVQRTVLSRDYGWSETHTGGRVKVALASGDPVALRGEGEFLQILFDVIGPAGAISPLTFVVSDTALYDEQFQAISVTLGDGSLTIQPDNRCARGDVTDDAKIQAVDAAKVLQIAVGKIEADDCSRKGGDVSGDGKIRANDAAMILYYATHAEWPPIPSNRELEERFGRAGGTLTISADDAGAIVGESFSVPIRLSDSSGVAAVEVTLTYDPALLTATGVSLDGLTTESFVAQTRVATGSVRFALTSDTPLATATSQTVARVVFTADAAGTSPLTLAAQNLYDLNGRDFVRSDLARTIEVDHGVATISGNGVPVGQSLAILVGLGTASAAVAFGRRKRTV
ncbi:MAG: hypothetical protein HYV63_04620 [Candidatus Schekmanbacteria bacterium]|nr:hypothetical protein [Candidatus Schekmanbacteria bacterium]